MTQPAIKPNPTQNVLAARVAAQARASQQQQGQPQTGSAPPRAVASLTPIRQQQPPPQQPQPSPIFMPTGAAAATATSTPAAAATATARHPSVHSSLDPATLTATELDQHLRAAVTTARRAFCDCIYYGYRLSLTSGWQQLGHATEESYVASLNLNWGTWQHWSRLGERLAHLTLADMNSLSKDILESLARVQPSLWPEYAWLEEAKVLPAREFDMLVRQRNHEHAPAGSRGLLSEPRMDIKVAIPISQQPVLQRRLDQLRRRERLATTGEALVFALEATDRAGLLEDSLAAIQQASAELLRLWKPGEEWSAALSESAAEKAVRLESGLPSLTDAAERTQQLTRLILRALRGLDLPEVVNEVLQETVPPTGTSSAGAPL